MGSQWRRQREELSQCKKTWKLSQVIIADSPTMKTFTKTGWTLREKLAAMLQCRSDWRLKQLLPKWKLKILEVGHRGVFDMRRKGLSVGARTTLCPDYEEKLANFCTLTQTKIVENSIEPNDIINMDEYLWRLTCLSLWLLIKTCPSHWKQVAVRNAFYVCSELHSIQTKASTNCDF